MVSERNTTKTYSAVLLQRPTVICAVVIAAEKKQTENKTKK